jgi:hypothetical protein
MEEQFQKTIENQSPRMPFPGVFGVLLQAGEFHFRLQL